MNIISRIRYSWNYAKGRFFLPGGKNIFSMLGRGWENASEYGVEYNKSTNNPFNDILREIASDQNITTRIYRKLIIKKSGSMLNALNVLATSMTGEGLSKSLETARDKSNKQFLEIIFSLPGLPNYSNIFCDRFFINVIRISNSEFIAVFAAKMKLVEQDLSYYDRGGGIFGRKAEWIATAVKRNDSAISNSVLQLVTEADIYFS